MLPITVSTTSNGRHIAKIQEHARHARGVYSEATKRAVAKDTNIFTAWQDREPSHPGSTDGC